MSPNGIKPLKILIVEDDLIDRKQLERFLSKSVLSLTEVKHTEYLETALELLDQDDFDIVLLDLNLTDSKGLDTLVKVTEKYPRVANIVITGIDREGFNLKAIAKGAQDYLVKGEFDVRMLSKSIYYAIERKKAELAMQERETQYRLLFESANEAIFIVKGEHILDCNPSTLRIFGCTKEQIVGHPFLQFYPELQPDGQDSTEKAWEKINLALEKKTQLFEWRCKRYDGTPFDAEVSLNPLELSGKVLLQVMVRDITDRKAAEEDLNRMLLLQQSVNSLQQSLLKTTPLEDKLKRVTDDIVNLFDADFCRIWLIRNGDLCEQGCIHAEVKEGPHVCQYRDRCLHLVSSSGRYTHIDGKTHRRVPFGCYKIGRVASGENHKFLTNDAQNDPRVHNHQWASELGLVSFAGYQLRIEGGETLGVLALFSRHPIQAFEDALLDGISSTVALAIQQALTSKQLQDSEMRLRTITESAQDAILTMDAQGAVSYWNPAAEKIFGYSKEEAMGRNVHELLAPERYLESHRKAFPKFVRTGRGNAIGKTLELAGRRKDGQEIVISLSLSAISVNGQWHAVGIVRDITEHKRAEVALRQEHDMSKKYLDTAGVMTIVLNEGNTLNLINKKGCEILGYAEKEILGKGWCDNFVPPEHREEVREVLKGLMNGETSKYEYHENPVLTKAGKQRLMAWHNVALWDEKKKIYAILSSGEDITERREAKDALRKTYKELETANRELKNMQDQLVQNEKLVSIGASSQPASRTR